MLNYPEFEFEEGKIWCKPCRFISQQLTWATPKEWNKRIGRVPSHSRTSQHQRAIMIMVRCMFINYVKFVCHTSSENE